MTSDRAQLTAAAIAVALVSSAAASCSRDRSSLPAAFPDTRSKILFALAQDRPLEGRLLDFPTAVPRAPRAEHRPGSRTGARSARASPPRQSGWRDLWDQALIDLHAGRIDAAVERMEQARRIAPREDALASDLSCLYLTRAARQDRPVDLLSALEAADQATALNPNSLEAQFNRALALQRLALTTDAQTAWRWYLLRDGHSIWARQARALLQTLEQPPDDAAWRTMRAAIEHADDAAAALLVAAAAVRFPKQAREFGEDDVLAGWAMAQERGQNQRARSWLALGRALGAGLGKTRGDWMLSDTIGSLDQSFPLTTAYPGAVRDERGGMLLKGHLAYLRGKHTYDRGEFGEAARRFAAAKLLLDRAGSPFAACAALQLARCAYQHSSYGRVLAATAPLIDADRTSRYPALRARSLRLVGLVRFLRADPSGSLAALTIVSSLA